jgi:hypothetical protein
MSRSSAFTGREESRDAVACAARRQAERSCDATVPPSICLCTWSVTSNCIIPTSSKKKLGRSHGESFLALVGLPAPVFLPRGLVAFKSE